MGKAQHGIKSKISIAQHPARTHNRLLSQKQTGRTLPSPRSPARRGTSTLRTAPRTACLAQSSRTSSTRSANASSSASDRAAGAAIMLESTSTRDGASEGGDGNDAARGAIDDNAAKGGAINGAGEASERRAGEGDSAVEGSKCASDCC